MYVYLYNSYIAKVLEKDVLAKHDKTTGGLCGKVIDFFSEAVCVDVVVFCIFVFRKSPKNDFLYLFN